MQDQLLTIDDTLQIIKKSRDWFYRYWRYLPFAFKVDGEIRCSRNEIDHWILQKLEEKRDGSMAS